jgi:ABC-type transporter Mla subunit MlaD
MSQTVMDRTVEHIADSAQQASRATNAVADAIGNGLGALKRAAKQGGDAAEEFLNDTTQRIQRHSVLTVAATFAVGLAAGAMLGWMMRRE